MKRDPVTAPPRDRRAWVAAAAAILAFVPALSNGLIWDDAPYVQKNPLFHLPWAPLLVQAFRTAYMGNWHPLTLLSLALDDRLGGHGPFVFHAVNVVLHAINAALLYGVLRRLVPDRDAALGAALLWAVHPLRVESVAWISERKDLLYAFFFLLALHAYLRYVAGQGRRGLAYAETLGFFAASTLAKAMGVSLVPVLFLADWLRRRRVTHGSLAEKIPFVVLGLCVGAVAIVAQKQAGAISEDANLGLPARLAFACYGLVFYLVKTVAPFGLSAFYPYPKSPDGGVPVVAFGAVALVSILTVLAIWSARRSRVLGFGAWFYVATLALVLQVLPVGAAVAADRYTYVPAMGLSVLGAVGLSRLGGEPTPALRRRRAVRAAVFGVAAVLGAATWLRCGVWTNELVFWNDVLEKAPDVAIARLNRGVALADRGDVAGAEADFGRGIDLDPKSAELRWARANLRAERGYLENALVDYDEAVRLGPLVAKYRFNQGLALGDAGRWDEALAALGAAIRLDPRFADAYLNRGLALEQMGRAAEGFPDVQRARALGYPVDSAVLARFARAARPGELPGPRGGS
jgi:tetratricopeptide (TPR) repeat protein